MVRIVRNSSNLVEGLEGYSYYEICNLVLEHIYNCIEEFDMSCSILAIAIYGSRIRHTSTPRSDLDVIVEYEGDEREDNCFNLFCEAPLYINNIKVDINPITQYKSGSIDSFIERCKIYDSKFS